MKKLSIIIAAFLCSAAAIAQSKFIDHLAIGLNYGTTSMHGKNALHYLPLARHTDGGGIEVMAQVTDWLEVRAGFSASIIGNGSSGTYVEGVPEGKYVIEQITLKHEHGVLAGSLFFDFYPFRKTTFHFIAGAYAGSSKLLEMYSSGEVPSSLASYNTGIVEYHGLTIPTDRNGEIKAAVKMSPVRPYLGIGISTGRLSSRAVSFDFDLGVMYKGNNGMTVQAPDGSDVEIDYWHSTSSFKRLVDWNKKSPVAPLLSIRMFIRVF